jgi:hypothetical protein
MNDLINVAITYIVSMGTVWLMPMMVSMYFLGIVIRLIVYFTTKCEFNFALEFEKRVYQYLADPDKKAKGSSFHQVTKHLLERTYHEHFELKQKYKRRRFDHVTSVTDRMFLIQAGALRLVTDTLSQTKYLQKEKGEPRFLDLSKFVFSSNPIFNRIVGVLPIGVFHETINILPGVFVVGGIFGTFLGTMAALPSLGNVDPSNVELTKSVMDSFLMNMTYSMGTSVLGIVLSVSMTFLNTICSPEGMYLNMINKFTSSLEFLWNDTETNDLSQGYLESVDPRTGRPQVNPVGPLAKIGWEKKHKRSGHGAAKPTESVPRNQPSTDGETEDQLRDKLSLLERLIEQTDGQRGALSPDAWAAQVRFLTDEKKKIEVALAHKQSRDAA